MSRRRTSSMSTDNAQAQKIRESLASVDTLIPNNAPPVKPPRRKSKQPPAFAPAPEPEKTPPEKLEQPVRPSRPKRESKLLQQMLQQPPANAPEPEPAPEKTLPVRPPRPKRESKLLEQKQQQPPQRPPPPRIPPVKSSFKVKPEPEPPTKPRKHDFDAGQRDADLIHLGNESRRMRCPSCGESVMTKTDWEPSMRTHTMAFLLCMFLLWPCVCLPYCIPACNEIDHFCPLCGEYLGPA